MLLNNLMIDQTTTDIRSDLYYSQCQPVYCAYSYAHRFDALFIITTLIGIFGGLSFVLRFIASLAATLIIQRKNKPTAKHNLLPHAKPMHQRQLSHVFNCLCSLLNSVTKRIVGINLFQSYTPRTATNLFREQILTRCFLCLLVILSTASGFYIFLVTENQALSIEQPSLDTYLQLYEDYPDTLQCSCSQLSVPYGAFLNVTLILHDICSSDLISSSWLAYISAFDPIVLPVWSETTYSRDFRAIGASYFQLLAIFCSLATKNIDDARLAFYNTPFINNYVPAPSFFAQQSQSIIESFIKNMRNDFKHVFNLVKTSFTTSYFLTGVNTNTNITIDNNYQVITKDITYRTAYILNTGSVGFVERCPCATFSFTCNIHSLIYLYGRQALDFEVDFADVPTGCIPLVGFLQSKTAWWYNETQLKYIRATYTLATHAQSPADIHILNSSLMTRFTKASLSTLIEEMFLESWISNQTYFSEFYHRCAPSLCSFTREQRRSLVAAFLLLVSVCGGLNRVLRLIVPAVGQLTFFFIDYRKNRPTNRPLLPIIARLKRRFNIVYESILNYNLYQTTSTDETDVHEERIYTRVYLILLTSCLALLLFYTAVKEHTITKTYVQPSFNDYEHLRDLYLNDISCPCTRISIPYQEFVTTLRVNAFHQACSTYIIRFTLIGVNVLYYIPNPSITIDKDFRKYRDVFATALAQLCTFAQQRVENNILVFQTSTMFVPQVMPRTKFNIEMNQTLTRFQQQVPIEFAQALHLIRTNLQGNALIAIFSTNWKFILADSTKGRNSSYRSEPVTYFDIEQNITCSCATSRSCTIPAQLFGSDGTSYYTFEGLVFGCYSLETVLRSSLSCFYSIKCVNDTIRMLGVDYNELVAYDQRKGYPIQLNASLTRFQVNDTIETMANEMFIESWASNVSYERFFNSCAPSYCTYKYYYRFDALDLLTTFLSVYAGLSLAIRFIVPYPIKFIRKIRHRNRVIPINN